MENDSEVKALRANKACWIASLKRMLHTSRPTITENPLDFQQIKLIDKSPLAAVICPTALIRIDQLALTRSLVYLVSSGISLILFLTPRSSWAQSTTSALANPIAAPPEVLEVLKSQKTTTPVVTAQDPSQSGLTVPSLWWTNEQFGDKLVSHWLTYPKDGKVITRADLVVRPEIWNQYTYFDRYAFVHHFGTVASDYGYNLLVFDRSENLLAAYTCNFAQVNPNYLKGVYDSQGQPVPNYVSQRNSEDLACQVWINPSYPSALP
jgi:hypothetical protein